MVAASVGLLLLIFSVFLLSQLRNSQQTISTLRDTNSSLQAETSKRLRNQQSQTEKTLALLRQPGTRNVSSGG